jgi:hypothetical protein
MMKNFYQAFVFVQIHGHMARGGQGLLKVSPGAAMPYRSTPCVWPTPEMALQLFLVLRPFWQFLVTDG